MKLLLELSYLNEACNLSENIEEKQFKINLKEAQYQLQDLLGLEFYEEIESQYDIESPSFSTDNDTLYEDYLKDFLAFATYADYIGFAQRASTPTGEREFRDDNSTLVSDFKLVAFHKNIKKKADDRKYAIINYLRNQIARDSTKFSLWVDTCTDEMSFAFSSISRNQVKDNLISIDKIIKRNE